MRVKRSTYLWAWVLAPIPASLLIIVPYAALGISSATPGQFFSWGDLGAYLAVYIVAMGIIYLFYAASAVLAIPIVSYLINKNQFSRTTVPIAGATIGLMMGTLTCVDTPNWFLPMAGLLMGFATAWCFWFFIHRARSRVQKLLDADLDDAIAQSRRDIAAGNYVVQTPAEHVAALEKMLEEKS